VLRRVSAVAPPAPKPAVLAAGDLVIDPGGHTVTRAGQPVQLAPLEFRLLYALAQTAGQVLSAEELLQRVWGPKYALESQILYVYIRSLRLKLEENPHCPRRITTVRNIGYKLCPQEL
jgi:two-component system, OmpR family, response regulator MtrA